METIKDYSYGVVPIMEEGGEWKVFVLHQIARTDTYWTFPKGHPENEENDIEAAKRELLEETGLMPRVLDIDHRFNQQYDFTHDGQTIEKHVGYYIGVINNPAYIVQEEEVLEAKWCTFAEARELLTFDLGRTLLDEVAVYLEDNKAKYETI